MKCTACSYDNPDSARFCGGCGQALSRLCVTCGTPAPDGNRFCGHCGAPLPTPESTGEIRRPERRHLTILFCDLVGSTELADRLDPEDFRNLVALYQRACGTVIDRFEGHVAQYLGDGILAYFGYPQAHERDPERAIFAALGIIDSIAELTRASSGNLPGLHVRIGVHTGLVVVGEVGATETREHLALGQAPNIAARLQAIALPDTVVVSADTRRLAVDSFVFEPLGEQVLKGVSAPVVAYQVIEETTQASRNLEGPSTTAVGRSRELAALLGLWGEARQERMATASITGEAGIGKTRLVSELRNAVSKDGGRFLVAQCSLYARGSAYHPLLELLSREFAIERGDDESQRLAKLTANLERLSIDPAVGIPSIAALFAIEPPETLPPPSADPGERRRLIHSTLLEIFHGYSREEPTVLVVDDLHWADPSTLEFLDLAMTSTDPASFFLVVTTRPSFELPKALRGSIGIELKSLPAADVRKLIEEVAEAPLPREVVDLIVERTDGVPLFVEELTRTLLESDQLRREENGYRLLAPFEDLSVPPTLRSSLMARLDRLGEARATAQLAAVLGREFDFELLQAASEVEAATLSRDLHRLVASRLLEQEEDETSKRYIFRHALIQEAAYASLLRSDRIEYHGRTARTYESLFPGICDARPEVVAHHFTESGAHSNALDYWERAGRQASERFANLEAIGHFEKGLEVLEKMDEGADRDARELAVRCACGPIMMVTYGPGSEDVAAVFERAYELCRQEGDTPELYWVLWGLGSYYQTHDFERAFEIAQQLMRMAQASGDPTRIADAYFTMGAVYFYRGDYHSSLEHLHLAQKLFDSEVDPAVILPSGAATGSNTLIYLGFVSHVLGRPEQGLEFGRAAAELADEHHGPPYHAAALCWHAWQHQLTGDAEAVLQLTEKALPLAAEYAFGQLWGGALQGWALARTGREAEGLEQLSRTLASYRGSGIRALETWLLSLESDAACGCGRWDVALAAARTGLECSAETGERFWIAELQRLEGEALRGLGEFEAAENAFRRALETASEQRASLPALRASLGLARLLEADRRTVEAQGLLERAVAAFEATDSFSDLDEVRQRLAETA